MKGKGKFNVISELQSLSFHGKHTSDYICRSCLQNLKKRRSLIDQLQKLESLLEETYNSQGREQPLQSSELKRTSPEDYGFATPKKVRESHLTEAPVTILNSSPLRTAPAIHLWPVSPVQRQDQRNTKETLTELPKTKNVDVTVNVKWPSKSAERKLPEDLESLGKMLVRGTYKQIANAAWKNPCIKKEVTQLMLKDIEKETTQLCSKKNPSYMRKTEVCCLSPWKSWLAKSKRERHCSIHFCLQLASTERAEPPNHLTSILEL